MGLSTKRAISVAVAALAALSCAAGDAEAQFVGVGARMASVSGPESPAVDDSDASRLRFWGGFVRLHLIGSLGFEAAIDYQSMTNDAETAHVRNTPIQTSLLLLNPGKTFAPYLLGGFGWYKHTVEALDKGDVVATASSTDFGYHVGGGVQLRLGRHAAIFADYRYVWVDENGFDGFSSLVRSASSLGSVLSLVSAVSGKDASDDQGISRGGSMWVGGLTVYF